MKNIKKSVFPIILAICLFINGMVANAAGYEIKKGKTEKFSIRYYYGNHKTIWNVNNKNAKIVKKAKTYCKVKALKTGKFKLKCKTGRLKYSWNVKVKDVFEKKKVKVKSQRTKDGVLLKITNKNKLPAKAMAKINFKAGEEFVSSNSEENECIDPGKTSTLFVSCNNDEFDSYEVNLSAEESAYDKYGMGKIKVSGNKRTEDGLQVKVTNNSKNKLNVVILSIEIYDAAGNLISYDVHDFLDCEEPRSSTYVNFYFPKDENGNLIAVGKYKINVDSAYYDFHDYI